MATGGFLSHGATPIAGWFLLGKIPLEWMMQWGTPILGNLQLMAILSHMSRSPLMGK